MKKSFLIIIALICQMAFAGDHELSDILGTNIALKSYDHAIAGSIKDFVIFGNTNEDENQSELIIKKHGQIIKSMIKPTSTGLGGTIQHQHEGTTLETTIKFVSINQREQKIILQLNSEPVEVVIKAEGFANNHFIKPQYIVTLANGESFDFKITDGEACYRASVHLTMMIISAYAL